MPDQSPKRPPTHMGDRNENRARVYTPPKGVPTGEFDREDLTDKFSHDPELLSQQRAKRPTPERLAKLEAKNDLLVNELLAANRWRRELIRLVITSLLSILAGLLAGMHL